MSDAPATSVAAVYDRRKTALTERRYRDLPARAAGTLVWFYQRTVSPALVVMNPGWGCRFAPTCSQYAREALAGRGLVVGTALALRRLAKCGPWHPGGEDLVPPAVSKTAGPQDHRGARRPAPICYSVRSS